MTTELMPKLDSRADATSPLDRDRRDFWTVILGHVHVISLATLLLVTTGCPGTFKVRKQPLASEAAKANLADFTNAKPAEAVLHYYGSGGWGIWWRGTYIVTAPYFSAADAFDVFFFEDAIKPNSGRVADGLARTPIAQTRLLLAGHGHYDHVGDVPEIWDQIAQAKRALPPGDPGRRPPLPIWSRTVDNTFHSKLKNERRIVLRLDDTGQPIALPGAGNSIRITPILSSHAPHIGGAKDSRLMLYFGRVKRRWPHIPTEAQEYLNGYTWAYLIELMDGNRVAFRIHYQDSASSALDGIPSRQVRGWNDVDLHIGCVPGSNLVHEYPKKLLAKTQARFVLLAHWEDFTKERDDGVAPLPRPIVTKSVFDRFLRDVDNSVGTTPNGLLKRRSGKGPSKGPSDNNWLVPTPGETLWFKTR